MTRDCQVWLNHDACASQFRAGAGCQLGSERRGGDATGPQDSLRLNPFLAPIGVAEGNAVAINIYDGHTAANAHSET
jgi:hypothetical protein